MAIETARPVRSGPEAALRERLARRWRRALPALLLVVTLAISLVGLFALGRSLQEWAGKPADRITATTPAGNTGDLAKSLTHLAWSQPDIPADVLLVSPAYFHAVGWTPKAEMNPRDQLIFMVAENIHDGNLPPFAAPALTVNGNPEAEAPRVQTMADSPHHRTTAVIFKRPPGLGEAAGSVGLVFAHDGQPLPGSLSWDAALLQDAGAADGATFHLTGASIVALLAGLIASMWPCLFQLTAYFIPSLAGISMSEARNGAPAVARLRVVKMATFFVLGFVIVYTLAGAAAGFAAQSFDTRSVFETWRRPLTIVAGGSMLVMAVRQAARARLPLACKMPVLGRVGKGGAQPSYGGAMLMGLAYATGCATCFGAAVLLGMLVYVGVAGAPFTGAAVMFLFSVGMGVPLIIGAALMAQVLPLLNRFDKAARYLGLAGAAMMFVMALLLLSDHFMGFSNEITQLTGATGRTPR